MKFPPEIVRVRRVIGIQEEGGELLVTFGDGSQLGVHPHDTPKPQIGSTLVQYRWGGSGTYGCFLPEEVAEAILLEDPC